MDYIENVRKELGLTVTELLRRAGVSRDSYYKCLRGERTPSIKWLNKVCKALGIEVKEVVEKFT